MNLRGAILIPLAGGGGGFDPWLKPVVAGLTSTSTIDPNDVNSISPSPGDVIDLDGTDQTLTSAKSISGWTGTALNPIVLRANGSRYINRQLSISNCQYVIFQGLRVDNSNSNGIAITGCKDCVFMDINIQNCSSNGVRVLGTTPYANANARLRFFDILVNGWGVDAFTLHADTNANNNSTHFLISGLTITGGAASDSGFDVTSAKHVWVKNIVSSKQTNIGHGVWGVYINGHVMTVAEDAIYKNTSGRIVALNFSGLGGIDLSEQAPAGIRDLDQEGNDSELPNNITGNYATYNFEYMTVTTIDNNSAGLGTITTLIAYDPDAAGDYASDLAAFVI